MTGVLQEGLYCCGLLFDWKEGKILYGGGRNAFLPSLGQCVNCCVLATHLHHTLVSLFLIVDIHSLLRLD